MEKNKKRKERGHEILLADDALLAQDWIVDASLTYDVIGEAMGVDDFLAPRRSARPTRELYDEDFESESEEEEEDVDEDVDE